MSASRKWRWTSRGEFQLHQLANVDQTPLPFSFTSGPTYKTTNSPSVWVRGASSGLDKRQCTVQLTIFADGKPRIKPLLIFRGTGKRIPLRETVRYDKRVTVLFQHNAWCDEVIMERWVRTSWKPYVSGDTLLVLDLHRAQKTDRVKELLKEYNTTPVFVPAGCTSIIQPLDVSFNAPFKKKVENVALHHMEENLDEYLNGRINGGERRVLLTKWVGEAWDELVEKEEMIIRSFKKCGISVAADGSEDFEIHLEGLGDYQVNQDAEFSTDSDEDPFADLSTDDSSNDNSSDAESDST